MKKVLCILLLFVLTLVSLNITTFAKQPSNGVFNIANNGNATSDGEYIYYSADNKLYKENISNGKKVVLFEGTSCGDLTVYGDYIYFTVFRTSSSIYRVDINGQKSEEYVGSGGNITIHDGYLYALGSSYFCQTIKKYNMNNFEDCVVIGETSGAYVICNNRIYFDNYDSEVGAKGFASMNLNGGDFRSYLIGDIGTIKGCYDGYVYFSDEGDLKRISASGNEEFVIDEDNVNLYDGYIYFRNKDRKLSRILINGGEIQDSGMDVRDTFCIVEDKVYSRSPDGFKDVIIYDLPKFTSTGYSDEPGNLINNNGANGDNDTTITSFGSETSIWAKEEVEKAYEDGLVPETLVGTDLTQKINRSEFAAVAVLIYENLTNKSVSATSTPFKDINSDPNKKAINKAYKLGITVGTSPTTFAPSRNITREELATMLCRGIKKYKFPDWTPDTDYMYYIQGTSGIKFADDAEISDYAKNSVYFMSSAGIIKGVDSTHFAPKASVTRGDALDYGMATREQAIIMAERIKENKSYFDDI